MTGDQPATRHPGRIEGPSLALRLIRPEDADYLFALRSNPALNRHLSPVQGGAADQRRWIEAYQAREAAGREFYHIIERLSDGAPCGTIRLYDIAGDRFTWGSWILDAAKPPKAALESAVLSFGLAFNALGLARAQVDVRIANTRAETFYRRFGMTETHRDAANIFFRYDRARYLADRANHLSELGN